jgi:cysteine desulfuration protein SufE
MMSIGDKEQTLIDDFAIYDDWMEKYEYIIELGKELPLLDENLKTKEREIKGCQSKVWMTSVLEDGKVIYKADADAIIAKGNIALLVIVLSGERPQDFVEAKFNFIQEIGLQEHLSPTRSNGLLAMLKQMKLDALALNITQ